MEPKDFTFTARYVGDAEPDGKTVGPPSEYRATWPVADVEAMFTLYHLKAMEMMFDPEISHLNQLADIQEIALAFAADRMMVSTCLAIQTGMDCSYEAERQRFERFLNSTPQPLTVASWNKWKEGR